MSKLNTDHLEQRIKTLEYSIEHLLSSQADSIEYEVFRNATIKGFELTLEICGKLLRKALKNYAGNPYLIDELTYKDLFRYAGKHLLFDNQTIERWFAYRNNRNNTALDYGIAFATITIKLLPTFLQDARELKRILNVKFGSNHVKS
ncbi:MAG: nucleotidyltransferase substrate binding protein [Gammaproteobacteria bacterium]|nr:nucleotidyltransferase substrate binding protein [Gammaproteobacteria bacterium]